MALKHTIKDQCHCQCPRVEHHKQYCPHRLLNVLQLLWESHESCECEWRLRYTTSAAAGPPPTFRREVRYLHSGQCKPRTHTEWSAENQYLTVTVVIEIVIFENLQYPVCTYFKDHCFRMLGSFPQYFEWYKDIQIFFNFFFRVWKNILTVPMVYKLSYSLLYRRLFRNRWCVARQYKRVIS